MSFSPSANIIALGHGLLLGWLSPSLPTLLSENSPLKSGPLTNEQLSWIGSINSIGALSGTFTTGLLTTFIGCKRAMLLLSVPSILFWILIYFGDTYYHVLIGRIFVGWTGGGIQTTLILFTSDIANDKWVLALSTCASATEFAFLFFLLILCSKFIWKFYVSKSNMDSNLASLYFQTIGFAFSVRGRLGCYTPLARNIGILFAYIVGAFVSYSTVPCVFIIVPILFAICFSFLPNTPQYHLLKGDLTVGSQKFP